MTIEIHEPELEALIAKQMETSAFTSIEDALLQALRAAPPAQPVPSAKGLTGADLIVVLQSIPDQEFVLEQGRFLTPISEPVEL